MAGNLTGQVRNVPEVSTAIAGGDLSARSRSMIRGEILQPEGNHQHDGRSARHASEVTRVAREVRYRRASWAARPWCPASPAPGRRSHRQRQLHGRRHLTGQVLSSAEVATAIANGDLLAQDHGRCEGRDPAAEGIHQYHGGPVERIRRRGDPCRPRSRHRGQPGWSGRGEGRQRGLEGS